MGSTRVKGYTVRYTSAAGADVEMWYPSFKDANRAAGEAKKRLHVASRLDLARNVTVTKD